MAVGYGAGEAKASEALDQALHHPLLETVSLESAAGIIVNFTGGRDLSLSEIQTVVDGLYRQAGPLTEIVMGVIQDERMEGRAQLILVVTGLGAPTLEEAMSNVNKAAVKPKVERPSQAAAVGDSALPPFRTGQTSNEAPVGQSDRLSRPAPPEPLPSPEVQSPAGKRAQPELASVFTNLDLPAFLRNRYHP